MSHYDTLGVSRDASPTEIKAAWRRASAAAHPDREGGSTERQQAVNRAYEVLSDPKRRAAYDATGSDEEKPSIDDQARKVLVQMISSCLDAEDVLAAASDTVRRVRIDLNAGLGERRQSVRRLEKMSGRVRVKQGDNLVEMLLQDRIAALKAEIDVMETGLLVNAAISKMLENYEQDSPPEATSDPLSALLEMQRHQSGPSAGGCLSGMFRRSPWRKA